MNPKKLCNILLNDFLGILNKHKVGVADCGITPEDFEILAKLQYTGAIDKTQFKTMVENRVINYKKEKQGL
jgi:Asp-tRNA(Asn)/Glu-tRNA(Gln) amidotransferase B subunit